MSKGKLKLTNLDDQDLEVVNGGAIAASCACGCSCYWANQGGSSTNDNMDANADVAVAKGGSVNSTHW